MICHRNNVCDSSRQQYAVGFCYGDEENARIYAVHLTTANQRGNEE